MAQTFVGEDGLYGQVTIQLVGQIFIGGGYLFRKIRRGGIQKESGDAYNQEIESVHDNIDTTREKKNNKPEKVYTKAT
jgi:hypothetical protein